MGLLDCLLIFTGVQLLYNVVFILLDNTVNQLYVYIYPPFVDFLPS